MPRHRLLFASVIAALPVALAACGGTTPSDPRTAAPLVRAAVVRDAASTSLTFTGTVAARVQSELGFRVSGKVLERLVNAGDTVKRGQVLMRIDAADLKLAVHAQQEAVTAARARALQTAGDEARYRNLRGSGAVSASAYDQAKAAADTAQAQLKAAQAQADVASNARRYAELTADADGIVMETLAEPGQVVNAGRVVVRLAQAGRREAVINLPETMRPALGSLAQATLFGKEGMTIPARLRQLSDTADRLTRTFEARYVLEGEQSGAPLGTTVTIRIAQANSAARDGLRVPMGALLDAGKGPGVWVIAGKPSKVTWHPVTIERLEDESAHITGQLKQGDNIVALGANLLREGEQVRIAGEALAATTATTAEARP